MVLHCKATYQLPIKSRSYNFYNPLKLASTNYNYQQSNYYKTQPDLAIENS